MSKPYDDRDIRLALTDASLDAPRVDLWGRLRGPTRDLVRARRPLFAGVRAVAAVLALVLVSAVAFAIAAQTRPQRHQASGAATVPDTLLVSAWDQSSQTQGLRAFMPSTNEFVNVLDGVGDYGAPNISPDGRQLFYAQSEQSNGVVTNTLFALDSNALTPQWSTVLASQSLVDAQNGGYQISVAVAGERIYTVTHAWGNSDPASIVAFGRVDGKEQARWTLELGQPFVNGVRIFAARDGSQLYVIAGVSAQPPAQNGVGSQFLLAYQRYELPSMTLAQRVDPSTGSTAQEAWYDRLTPDGRALYTIGFANNASGMAVSFFDLASGTAQAPLVVGDAANSGFLYQEAVSPDGKLLYAFNPSTGALSIFDLTSRQLAQTIDVDMSRAQGRGRSIFARAWDAVRAVFVQDASAKVYFQGTMQLSPDGSRLYAISVKGGGIDGTPDGILVIDTQSWQVLDRWATDSAPAQLERSADGKLLYVYSPSWYANAKVSGLLLVDTTTGATTTTLDLATGNGGATIYSLAGIYRTDWGTTPQIAGVDGALTKNGSSAAAKPFPRLEVTVDRATVLAGDTVTVTARYLDPVSGEPINPDSDTVRYTAPDNIRAVLSRGGNTYDDITVVLTGASYGVYHGAAMLNVPGTWDVRVKTERSGEPKRSASLLGAVAVQSAFVGTDGRRYLLRLTTDPAEPAANQEMTASVAFVDAATGAALPDNVDLASGLPDKMDASFFGAGGVTSAYLLPTAHGVYAGSARLFAAGNWKARVDFRSDGAASSAVDVGSVVAK